MRISFLIAIDGALLLKKSLCRRGEGEHLQVVQPIYSTTLSVEFTPTNPDSATSNYYACPKITFPQVVQAVPFGQNFDCKIRWDQRKKFSSKCYIYESVDEKKLFQSFL